MNRLTKAVMAIVGLSLALSLTANADPLGYTLDVTTHYQFGNPAGTLGPYPASPDSGFFTITNNGSTTFTGTIGEVAISNFGGDFSYSLGGLTISPGGSLIFSTSPESSNVGGFNGPFGSPQPGIEITINGLINGTEAVALSVNDADIHSGVARTGCDGVSSDSYVMQGGAPTGCDNGDAFETTQADGNFRFFEAPTTGAVPEPGSIMLLGTTLSMLGLAGRRRRRTL